MAVRESPGDRGRRRGDRLVRELLDEFREARLAAGLTQAAIGRSVGLSKARISVIERGEHDDVPFVVVSQLLSCVGLELSARAYPVGGGLRDRGQIRLLHRLRTFVPARVPWRTEVPIGGRGDLRAWDAVIGLPNCPIGVDAETRLRDFQAVDRRVMQKARDSGVRRVVLLVGDTRGNRAALRELGLGARSNFPVPGGAALAAIRCGQDPGGNAIVVL
ncbi:MAG TPA: helix-turn-helix transcriptional regulator [Candidatus Limnocylindrales bacterium]|nr:helix-turn-helix transcriptional regulator [Candidatus Limnocylindrales bacterium]